MGPAAPVGSAVIGRRIDAEDVRVGDVILLHRDAGGRRGLPVLHRVVWLEHRDGQVVVQTKGDANPTPDSTRSVLRGQTVTPVYVVPYVGYLIGYAQRPLGWTLLVLIPTAALGGRWLRALWASSCQPATHP
jgi:signal peptidase